MTWQKPDISYWNNKFAAWWHDPIDKVFGIPSHEARAADYLQTFGINRPNDEFWKLADAIAAGFERGQVPTYSSDNNKNGAVDFAANPVLTHPTTAKEGALRIVGASMNLDRIHAETLQFLKDTIGMTAGSGDYAARFEKNPERFAVARFLFTHLVLRFLLSEKNVGGLGALWHRVPADSRFPDHTIWQHNALCSAFYSCIEIGGRAENVGLMVFSISPVQGFIAGARKMRDFWVGSIFLSWLAFEGLRWIMENLGPDHVLYPSLVDQPFVNAYLERQWHISGQFKPKIWESQPGNIASLPNKFLFLLPFDQADTIAEEIKKALSLKWEETAQATCDYLVDRKGTSDEHRYHLQDMFGRQNRNFWNFHWAASRLAGFSDKGELAVLLDHTAFENQYAYLDNVRPLLEQKGYSLKDASRGILYSVSHTLAQAALAAEKVRRKITRSAEPGEKCQMCGEFEVLHSTPWGGKSAADYKKNIKEFWSHIAGEDDFKENERLCSICFLKRVGPRIFKKDNDHILNHVFRDAESFPSTTMMSLTDYFRRNKIKEQDERKRIADELHDSKTDTAKVRQGQPIKNADKYFAILMMDGDHLGRLVNGETIASSWSGIMHPDIVEKLTKPTFDSSYRKVWESIFKSPTMNKRLVTPAIHAAISEALGDFSVYGVSGIIRKHKGRLIYAGGDDVCAFLPIQTALFAAREIADYYTTTFRFIGVDGTSQAIGKEWTPKEEGKLSVNLGIGEEISISAAILLCHHKESLVQMIERAQQLLKQEAKKKAKRNACVIELRKRHGGSRIFMRKWSDAETWSAFEELAKLTAEGERQISNSLLYRLAEMQPGIEALMTYRQPKEENLVNFIAQQLERSGTKSDVKREEIARWMTHIVWDRNNRKKPFNPEGLLIPGFVGGEVENDGMV